MHEINSDYFIKKLTAIKQAYLYLKTDMCKLTWNRISSNTAMTYWLKTTGIKLIT